MTKLDAENYLLGIVGPCSAGKSTLIDNLQEQGFKCRHIAQEHSFVPDMWQKIANPSVLIYLDVTYKVSMQRRRLNLTPEEFNEQLRRLLHAKQNADIYINTDMLSPREVHQAVLDLLGYHIE